MKITWPDCSPPRVRAWHLQTSMDPQGRMPIREELREEADLSGEVTVTWEGNLLRVTSMKTLRDTPNLTAEQLDSLKDYGL